MGALFLIATFTIAGAIAGAFQDSAADLNNRGAAAYTAGDFRSAELALQSASRAEEFSPDAALRSKIVFNLAAVYRAQARYTEAEALYRRSINLREAILGTEDAELAGPLLGLSATLVAKGNLRAGEQFARRAVALREARPGLPLELAASQTSLMNVLVAQSRYDEAEKLGRIALRNLETAKATETIQYAEALNSLGILCRIEANYQSAEEYLTRTSDLFVRLLGPANTATAAAWNNLGQVMVAEKKLPEARQLFERAIAAWERRYGHNHPDVASGMTNLAGVFKLSKQYPRAEELYEDALQIDQAAVGPSNPKVALDLNNLGSLAVDQRRYAEAETFFKRSLAIYEGTSGQNTFGTGLVSGNLGMVYVKQKRFAEAEPLLLRAARIREEAFGPNDRALASLLEAYAHVLRLNRKYTDAAQAETRAMTIRVHGAIKSDGLLQGDGLPR